MAQMNDPKPRRVGSFSAGIFLILFGIGLLICTFLPEPLSALSFLARFSPLLLILLGAELLYSHLRAKTTPIRFDGFSVFFCIVVLFFGIGASLASLGARTLEFSWQNQRYESTLNAQAQDLASSTLHSEKDVIGLSVHFNLNGHWEEPPTLETALREAQPYINVTLHGAFADETAFAARCQALYHTLWKKGFRRVSFHAAHFTGGDYDRYYDLTLDSAFALTAPPQALYEA